MLLDAGEGSYGMLYRRFGEKLDEVLRERGESREQSAERREEDRGEVKERGREVFR